MTSENRLDEIDDYTEFIGALYDEYKPQFADNVRIHLLGFSQGAATQCRWIMKKLPDFDKLILWAGVLPEDIDYTPHTDYFKTKNIYFIYGTADPFVTTERVNALQNFAQKQQLSYKTFTFEGKHTVDRDFLKILTTEYLKKSSSQK